MHSKRQARQEKHEKNRSRGSGKGIFLCPHSRSTVLRRCCCSQLQPIIISLSLSFSLSPLGPWRYCTCAKTHSYTETVIPDSLQSAQVDGEFTRRRCLELKHLEQLGPCGLSFHFKSTALNTRHMIRMEMKFDY